MIRRLQGTIHLLVASAFLTGLGGSAGAHVGLGYPTRVPEAGPGVDTGHLAVHAAHSAGHATRHSESFPEPAGDRAATESSRHSRSHHDEGVPCDCVGACHGAATVPLPALGGHGPSATPHGFAAPMVSARGPAASRVNAYLLPFANAPPAV